MYGALPTRPRLGLAPRPNCPISQLDDGLIVAIFTYLKPNHLRFSGSQREESKSDRQAVQPRGYRCSSEHTVRMGELVSYVSIVELIQCSMVCRQWRRCAQLRALWEEADLSRFSSSVNDDLVLRIAQMAGRRLRSLCLNQCSQISDISLYHLASHCPLMTEIHLQACPQLSAPAVLNLIRTLAFRNGLVSKPTMLSIELAKCHFLTPAVLEEIEKTLYNASREAAATGLRRRSTEEVEEEYSRRTDEKAALLGAPGTEWTAAAHPLVLPSAARRGAPADEDWRQLFELDVGLCNMCNCVVDLSEVGRCSVCSTITCEQCSDTPGTCDICCESFCSACRLLATCTQCQKDYCDECQEVLMCAECDAVLCPECHSGHECRLAEHVRSHSQSKSASQQHVPQVEPSAEPPATNHPDRAALVDNDSGLKWRAGIPPVFKVLTKQHRSVSNPGVVTHSPAVAASRSR